jgi:hypothetical protein
VSQFDELGGEPGTYTGSSMEEAPNLAPAIEHAIVNAYKKGLAAKPEEDRLLPNGDPRTFRFKVDEIYIDGFNPPTDYKVVIKDHGHN